MCGPPSKLIKLDLPTRDQRLLQSTADLDGINGTLESHWGFSVVQAASSELIRLGNERFPEPAVVVGRNLPPDTRALVDVHQVTLRLRIDRQLALGASHLCRVLLTGRHHSRTEELGDLPPVELHDAHRIVAVVVLSQLRRYSGDAYSTHRLDDAVLAEKPQRQINVVDTAIDENPTRELGVGNKEARWVEFIASLAPDDRWPANKPTFHLLICIPIAGIEPARKPTDDFLSGVLLLALSICSADTLRNFNTRTQRLLTEDMQSQLDGFDGLLGVHSCGGRDNHSLQTFRDLFAQHLIVGEISAHAVKVSSYPCQLRLLWGGSGDELSARGELVEMLCVAGAHAAQARDGDFELW